MITRQKLSKKKTLLLTGFPAFGNWRSNPTEWLLKQLEGKNWGEWQIKTALLPVSFAQAPKKLIKYLDKYHPDCAIALGLAGTRCKISLERVAINYLDCQGLGDNLKHKKRGVAVVRGGENAYFSSLPLERVQRVLAKHGYACEISNTAGTYVCNQIFYTLMKKCPDIPAGFIHLPPTKGLVSKSSWTLPKLESALWCLLKTCLKRPGV